MKVSPSFLQEGQTGKNWKQGGGVERNWKGPDSQVENRLIPKLGNILLKARKITPDHLEEAIEKQGIYKKKIGEILIMMGVLNPEDLDLYLLYQTKIKQLESSDQKIDSTSMAPPIPGIEMGFKQSE